MNKKFANKQPHPQLRPQLKPLYAAVLLAFAVQTAQANPTGGIVASGQASFATSGNTLTVTNTPGTIINWQGFSIGANEITLFAQQSASSAVLNRVISSNPSNILGTLQSNGRVFLINPNGIVFGAGAIIDVAGMVASTLNLSDADFLAGRNNFTQVPGAQNVSNAGNITAQNGGQIYLIAPNVENTGVITAPNGEILLAAGASVELVNSNDPNLRISITAPAGDATNVGKLIASSGSLGLFGTVVRNSGTVSADSATLQGGKIVFKASQRVEAGGTITANGTSGGSVDVSAAHSADPNAPGVVIQTGVIQAQGSAGAGGSVSMSGDSILSAAAINADGTEAGGLVSVQANNRALSTVGAQYTANSTQGQGGDILVSANVSNYTSGSYSTTGITGGNLTLAGNEIKLAGAQLDASGTSGGGNIHVGGLMHGAAGFAAQGVALNNSTNVLVNGSTIIKADALQTGNGGQVVLWSDQTLVFAGNISAMGGVLGGNGGMAEVSGLTSVGYYGLTNLSAPAGLNGTLLLDPLNITIVSGNGGLTSGAGGPSVLELIDPIPGAGEGFGGNMTELANGNIVIASPLDSFGGTSAGAVYLYSPAGTLLSTLTGSTANDNVGIGGITQLASNGSFVVVSPNWGAGVSNINPLGAVTWGSATAGVSGSVSSANSVVGTLANDQIGRGYSGAPVVALSNGNYVVASAFWNGAAGAATWVDGTTGHVSDYAANGNTNVISSANSLVGGTPGDYVGYKVIALPGNGNYVVGGATAATTPTATWVNGTNGQTADTLNTISVGNSLMGSSNPYALTNGNYVVVNGYYAGAGSQRGVATWVNGANGLTSDGLNVISAANSIIGQTNNDMIGQNGVIALPNGNYVLANFNWNWNASGGYGAVTWVNGATGQTSNASNIISQSNSVVGNNYGEQVGAKVVVLTNSNYVIGSFNWRGPEASFRNATGAATWVNGATGLTANGSGLISQNNSLLGFNTSDMVGYNITALSNGNYVVGSPFWGGNQGAVTWGNGLGGTVTSSVGFVTATNSLVGSLVTDYVGSPSYSGGNSIFALPGGNYVVGSGAWNGNSGAVTWGNGATAGSRTVGPISSTNSIVGAAGQYLGYATILSNGNYVVGNSSWNGGMGAATWVDGSTGQVSDYAANGNTNIVSATNSLVGSVAGDYVGGIGALSNGNYVVLSSNWNGGMGAATWVDGTTGQVSNYAANSNTNIVSATNSLVGSIAGDQVGNGGITELGNNNYAVNSYSWNNGAATAAGAVTWANSLGTTVGAVSAANSLVGSAINENIGFVVVAFKGTTNLGNAYVGSGNANAGAGRAFILGATVAGTPATGTLFTDTPATDVTIGAGNIAATLNLGTNVVLQANNDITQLAGAGISATGTGNLTLQAGRSVTLNDVVNIGGALNVTANYAGVTAAEIAAIAANRSAGAAALNTTLATITAKQVALSNSGGDIAAGAITATGTGVGAIKMEAGGNITLTQALINSAGGSVEFRADMNATCVTGATLCGTVIFTGLGHVTAATTNIYYDPTGSNGAVPSYATPTDYTTNVTGTLNAAMLVNDVTQLQAMNTNLAGAYALGANIGASATSTWNLGAGFASVGDGLWNGLGYNYFSGQFDGLGHTISNLYINRTTESYVGLFGSVSGSVSNVVLVNASVTGNYYVGGLAGYNWGSISNSSTNGNVTGSYNVGGLVGGNSGSISNSSASGSVTGTGYVGGLLGYNIGSVSNSYVDSGAVNGTLNVGGLVGYNSGALTNAYYNISGVLINGANQVTQYGLCNDVLNINGVGQYNNWFNSGLLTPLNIANYSASLVSAGGNSYTIGDVHGMKDLLGFADNAAYTFSLTSNINLSTTPGLYIPYLAANFDGANFTISNLSVNQSFNDNLGLFGHIALGSIVSNVALLNAAVTGNSNVGALAGWSQGTINNSNVLGGTVSGVSRAGGLVGFSYGNFSSRASIGNSNATNVAVSGSGFYGGSTIGGLVGSSIGTVSGSYVSGGSVLGNSKVGGLVGGNDGGEGGSGSITNSHVINGTTVTGFTDVGGLAGSSAGSVSTSYVNGITVSGTAGSSYVGGLVGYSSNLIDGSSVVNTAVSGGMYVGGLAGYNWGSISNSYVSGGTVSGAVNTSDAGGLVGNNAGTISNSYATGGVSGTTNVGGLVGYNSGTVSNNFWDTETAGAGVSFGIGYDSVAYGGTDIGATGLTATGMMTMSNFTGAGWSIANTGGAGRTWRIYEGSTTPLLTSFLKTLTVTLGNDSKTYDGLGYVGGNGGVTYTDANSLPITPIPGVLSGLLYGGSANGAVNAGSYAISASGLYSSQQGYDISYVDATLTVNTAALTVTANNALKTYDGLAYSGGNGVTYTGLVNGETSSVLGGTPSYGGSSQGAINAGSYAITSGGLSSGNYFISYVNGQLTVTPAALTVIADLQSKVYGNADPALTYVVTGLVNGETTSVLTGGLSRITGENVGAYAINQGSLLANSNYSISYTGNSLSITARPINILADALSKVYGDADPTLTYTVGGSGLASWDTNATTFSGTLSRVAGENVAPGPYAINQGGLVANSNYTISYIGSNLTITPATLTVAANDANKIMSTTDPLLTYTVSGLKLSDTEAAVLNGGSLSRVLGETVGAYPINQGALGLKTANYTMNYVAGSFTILAPTVINEIVNISVQDTTSSDTDKKPKPGEVIVVADAGTSSGDTDTQSLPVCR